MFRRSVRRYSIGRCGFSSPVEARVPHRLAAASTTSSGRTRIRAARTDKASSCDAYKNQGLARGMSSL